MSEMNDMVDALLEASYWVVDLLPVQVPQGSSGRLGEVRRHYVETGKIAAKKLGVLLRLNCYVDLKVFVADGDTWCSPTPEELSVMVGESYLTILCGQSLIVSDPEDTHITLFNPSERLLNLMRSLALAEGLFLWRPPQ